MGFHIVCILLLVLGLKSGANVETFAAHIGKTNIVDITQIQRDYKNNQTGAIYSLNGIARHYIGSKELLFYFEIFINEQLSYLEKAIDFSRQVQLQFPALKPKCLIRIYDFSLYDNTNVQAHVEELYKPLILLMANHSNLFHGFAVEFLATCDLFNATIDATKEIKSFLLNGNISLKFGYAFFKNYNRCNVSTKMIDVADFYMISNIILKRSDYEFVESYGIFKENMDRIANMTSVFTDKTVYFRAKMLQELNNYKSSNEVNHRYGHILSLYLEEWNSEKIKVIQTYNEGYALSDYQADTNWLKTEKDTVLHMTSISLLGSRGLELKGTFPLSIQILLEDISTAGYGTIMMSRKSITALKGSEKEYFPPSQKPKSLPHNIMLLEDTQYSSDESIKRKPIEVGEMKVQTILVPLKCSNGFTKSDLESISKYTDYNWQIQTENISTSKLCDDRCIKDLANRLKQQCRQCRSIVPEMNTIVWKVTINIASVEFNRGISGGLKILNAFDVAKRELREEKQYSRTQFVLQIEGKYIGSTATGRAAVIYCCALKEKMLQFYEAILTWTKIHNFPVILEPTTYSGGYNNPVAWKKLEIKGSGDSLMKKVMDSGPLYVRRRHNKSVVFGDWMKGMYPCIKKALNTTDAVDLNFYHNYAGVSISCDLKSGKNSKLSELELETLLILALKRFYNVEIVVQNQNQIQVLWNIVSDKSFKQNLKDNDIKENNIFLRTSQNLAGNEKLAKLKQRLNKVKNKTQIISNFINSGQDADGLVHDNCTELAYEIVIKQNFNRLSKIGHLVCNTEPFMATTSYEINIQDFLDTHLYLNKLFRYVNPNLKEIYFSLHPILIGDTEEEKSMNLRMFLSDVNNYAKIYQIRYFLLPAFPTQSQHNSEASFWKILNYTNLTDSTVFQEVHSSDKRKNPWKPQITGFIGYEEDEDLTSFFLGIEGMTLYLILGLVFVTIVIAGCVLVRIQIQQRFMTTKEINEFLHGKQEAIEASIRTTGTLGRRKHKGTIFDGLMHQKIYDLSKNDIILNTKNILGKGGFSSTYKAKLQTDNTDVVVKIPNQDCTKNIFKGMLSEVKLLSYVGESNSNIVNFVGCYVNELNNGVLWIVTEYCNGRTLSDYLKNFKGCVSKQVIPELLKFAHEIACGMEYIADQNVIHGTLSAKHVLLDHNGTCKIKGFGLVGKIKIYQTFIRNNERELLPWRWIAPESLRKLDFTLKSDIWSYGVTLWEIFSPDETPYAGVTWSTSFVYDVENGLRLTCPMYASNEIFHVMQRCWEIMPELRPDFTKLLMEIANIVT